ncbi:winged helix-turn-helix transcriptional regulator [Chryseobacterium culicis]|uniref:Transcriptional regulator, HxlR family n=1 Tax=Chryseobacterium culicis TaxID=680127 RepID=A0A1H6HGR5_CHRCI|nr:helix-turn-helix domain-containing protein [Chryseobacterium culicis]SEH34646.1 transcriptional regulator, HxlR family [Chryseobacterium culicis]
MRKKASTNFENERFLEFNCPFITTLRFIGKRWKPAVLWKINEGIIRFNQLKKVLPYISDKMLSDTIAELESDGVIRKEIFDEIPLRVEYQLTEFGKGLLPVLEAMDQWGGKTIQEIRS